MAVGPLSVVVRGNSMDPPQLHEILRNSRRRLVIEELGQRKGGLELRDLAEQVAAAETGETPPPRDVRDSVYNTLHQNHLPKLDEMEVIDYDDNRKRIRLRDRYKEVNRTMQAVTSHGISWAQFYRTVAVVALSLIVLTQSGVPPFEGVPVLLVASVTLFVFAIATAYQMWTLRWFYVRSLFSGD